MRQNPNTDGAGTVKWSPGKDARLTGWMIWTTSRSSTEAAAPHRDALRRHGHLERLEGWIDSALRPPSPSGRAAPRRVV